MNNKAATAAGIFVAGMAFMAVLEQFADSPVFAQNAKPRLQKAFVNPSPMGFTNVVSVDSAGTKTIYVSGQVGFKDNQFGESLEQQSDFAFANVVSQLEAAGAKVDDVIKLNVYVKDLDPPKTQVVGQAKAKYFTQGDQPASTWVGITSLVHPQLLVEVEAIAVISS